MQLPVLGILIVLGAEFGANVACLTIVAINSGNLIEPCPLRSMNDALCFPPAARLPSPEPRRT